MAFTLNIFFVAVVTTGLAFSQNFVTFCVIRFFCGVGAVGYFLIIFVWGKLYYFAFSIMQHLHIHQMLANRSGGCRQEIPRCVRFRLPVDIHRGQRTTWFSGLLRSRLENAATHRQCTNVHFCRLLLV